MTTLLGELGEEMLTAAQELLLTKLAGLSSIFGDAGTSIEFVVSETLGGASIHFVSTPRIPRKLHALSIDSVAMSDLHELVRQGYVMRTRGDNLYQITNEGLQHAKQLESTEQGEPAQEAEAMDARRNEEELLRLPNRKELQEDIDRLLGEREIIGIGFIDLDGFKEVNDQRSHAAGNECLESVVKVVNAVVAHKGRLYRYGGDEFVVVLRNATSEEIRATAERLRFEIEAARPGGELKVTATVGTASSEFPELDSAASLLDAADKCMLAGKRQGKNRVVTYAPLTPPHVGPGAREPKGGGQAETGDLLAAKAASEIQLAAETSEREAALDRNGVALLEVCYEIFCRRVAEFQERGTLAATSTVVRKNRPGAAFALDDESCRGTKSGICAFEYRLSVPAATPQVAGWLQVEVPIYSKGDPVLVVRWLSTSPRAVAERVLQQPASGLTKPDALAEVQAVAERQMAETFGRVMAQLSALVKDKE